MYYTSGIATKDDENPLEAHKRKLQEMADEKERKKKEREEKAARKAAEKSATSSAGQASSIGNSGCPYCGKNDHKTWRSQKCGEHLKFLAEKLAGEKGRNKRNAGASVSVAVGEVETAVEASPKQNT